MTLIPSLLLKQLYTNSSLQNGDNEVRFTIKNRLSDAELYKINFIKIDEEETPLSDITLVLGDQQVPALAVSEQNPLGFALRTSVTLVLKRTPLAEGKHSMTISFETSPFGKLECTVEDSIESHVQHIKIPRNHQDDYSPAIIQERRHFLHDFVKNSINPDFQELKHITQFSFDAHLAQGNCEHFIGAAQVPLGIAGPLLINGEHAQGEFLIPMATAEGTLVASYNRGMSVINLSGGVKCTVLSEAMQRAPVFVFEDARAARDFNKWVQAHFKTIAYYAEQTSSVAKLQDIDIYLSHKFAYLRFNYTTGDAAGQNMVGRATFAACSWIFDHYKENPISHFYLESNFATDKKASQVNMMRTRGKRVVAECIIKRQVLIERMRVEPEKLFYHAGVANVGAILSGANNNGLHSANGITAMFIATGQDVANVAESSVAVIYSELTPEKDLYLSITLPSLIVATYGGGTGLATQRECLEMLDCYGKNKVQKFAEIVAGVVLAGEISLASAISSSDWVSSHEKYGRNR
ncbi:MAG: hydroxymethylglutaryl-CoA reductase [Microscillaceae bacterium]|jgi:hydroxymethylglutaryl-CoA reductase (NADPH)|nr:hydroxymethylglutaryl-CoA reductase [Microscillaceae bacterium]